MMSKLAERGGLATTEVPVVVNVQDGNQVLVVAGLDVITAPWFRTALRLAGERLDRECPGLELVPWTPLPDQRAAAKRIIDVSSQLFGAVVVLAPPERPPIPEDSAEVEHELLIEAGMLIGRLGLTKILLLTDEAELELVGSFGVDSLCFSPGEEPEETSEGVADGIVEFVERIARDNTASASRALRRSISRFTHLADASAAAVDAGTSEEPITLLDADQAYLDALSEVQSSFLATTYIDSDFWTSSELDVLAANERMLRRVRSAGGRARRLIILPHSLDEAIEFQLTNRSALRSTGPDRMAKLDRDFRAFVSATLGQIAAGYEVKVATDRHGVWEHLPSQLQFDPHDTELAVYDGSRIDVFGGFASTGRHGVKAYAEGLFPDFPILKHRVEEYFEALWSSEDSYDFSVYAKRMSQAIEAAGEEIDYTLDWMLMYEAADGIDNDLKDSERDFVVHALEQKYDSGKAQGHIDLGTCTGRYLSELAGFVDDEGQIVGVDHDPDCLNVLRLRQQIGDLDPRVEIHEADMQVHASLPQRGFDIVTCMMGTICHLRRGERQRKGYEDDWQLGLEAIAALMSPSADAFVSVWDPTAFEPAGLPPRLLSFYKPEENSILCRQSPPFSELEKRARQAGLRIVESEVVGRKLRVMHLRSLNG